MVNKGPPSTSSIQSARQKPSSDRLPMLGPTQRRHMAAWRWLCLVA